jgi:hypothetical protein
VLSSPSHPPPEVLIRDPPHGCHDGAGGTTTTTTPRPTPPSCSSLARRSHTVFCFALALVLVSPSSAGTISITPAGNRSVRSSETRLVQTELRAAVLPFLCSHTPLTTLSSPCPCPCLCGWRCPFALLAPCL